MKSIKIISLLSIILSTINLFIFRFIPLSTISIIIVLLLSMITLGISFELSVRQDKFKKGKML